MSGKWQSIWHGKRRIIVVVIANKSTRPFTTILRKWILIKPCPGVLIPTLVCRITLSSKQGNEKIAYLHWKKILGSIVC